MSVLSLLGTGSQCRVWEFGTEDHRHSVAVVVAETAGACRHLKHSYRVFTDLARKVANMQNAPPLYSPQYFWSDGSKAVCVFAQAGERWTVEMYREALLTRQDLHDIVDQIKLFHDHDYIHCDVALRNFVRYEMPDGEFHSVLIDAGAAVKNGELWCGGTLNNAAISWLVKNKDNAQLIDSGKLMMQEGDVAVPSKEEELWSFVFAVLDLCWPNPSDREILIKFRQQQVELPGVAAIGKLVDELRYSDVANAVADLVGLCPNPVAS